MTYDERCRVAVLTRIAQKMKFSKSFLPPPSPPKNYTRKIAPHSSKEKQNKKGKITSYAKCKGKRRDDENID